MSTDPTFIQINERAYKYIRQFTIKNAESALIELITNSIDAYNKSGKTADRTVDIEYHDNGGVLKVRDNALGLTGEDMEKCFLQVGDYTNSGDSRGFFSRGAKDISAIGHITFHAIKDNKYSRVYLNSDAYGAVEVTNQEITTERETTGIIDNGVLVVVDLLSNFENFVPSEQAESLSNLTVLRDIMNDDTNIINYTHFNSSNAVVFTKRLNYTYPAAELLLDLTYNVPNYPEASANFKIYKTATPIPQPKKENEIGFGFLIKSDSTIFESSTLDDRFRWNPYMPYVYGHVQCNHIAVLLQEYDSVGTTAKNPVPIIDPSRLTGVNNSHPFIESLLSIPKVRLDQILRELNQSISQNSINITEVGQLFDELAKYGLDIVETEDVKVKFVPEYDNELARAIEDDRTNFVTSERSYLIAKDLNVKRTQTDNYVQEQIIRIVADEERENFVFTVNEEGELVQIPFNPTTDTNDIVDILETVEERGVDLSPRPYVYKLGAQGELVKLYIFEKGRVESVTNPEDEYVVLSNKKFQISFINDINISQRYIIENSDGVHIKLNINDPLIKKYLVSDETAAKVDMSITSLTSSNSLVFMRELIIEILADVILESDVINNKLILESNNYINTKKILTHRNLIINKLESPVDQIFDKYLADNKASKTAQLTAIIDNVSSIVGEKFDMDTEGGELTLLKTTMLNTISKLVE